MAIRVTPPTVEPMTAVDVRLRLRYNRTDQDVAITEWIAAARDALERYLERGLLTQTWELKIQAAGSSGAAGSRASAGAAVLTGEATESHVDYFAHNLTTYRTARVGAGAFAAGVSSAGGLVVDLPWAAPLQTVEAITDEIGAVPVEAYAVDRTVEPARLYFVEPGRPSGVTTIRYVVGYGDEATDVPATLRQVVLALVQQYFLFRAGPPPTSALEATLQSADGYRVRDFA